MLKTLILIGIGAAGTYLAYKLIPGKLPMPCPCNTTNSQATSPIMQTAMPLVAPTQPVYA